MSKSSKKLKSYLVIKLFNRAAAPTFREKLIPSRISGELRDVFARREEEEKLAQFDQTVADIVTRDGGSLVASAADYREEHIVACAVVEASKKAAVELAQLPDVVVHQDNRIKP